MGHTDAHLPYAVRVLDPTRAIEVHDHRYGPCTLPPVEEWLKDPQAYKPGLCYWELSLADQYENHTCGCSMCTGKIGRKSDVKKARQAGKREAREQAADWADVEDVDD